jgi:hypothetical protein
MSDDEHHDVNFESTDAGARYVMHCDAVSL